MDKKEILRHMYLHQVYGISGIPATHHLNIDVTNSILKQSKDLLKMRKNGLH